MDMDNNVVIPEAGAVGGGGGGRGYRVIHGDGKNT